MTDKQTDIGILREVTLSEFSFYTRMERYFRESWLKVGTLRLAEIWSSSCVLTDYASEVPHLFVKSDV